jgi:hypothetical protein
MNSTCRVEFSLPGSPDPGTVIPLDIHDVSGEGQTCSHVEKTANRAVVQIDIPSSRRSDFPFIVYRALDELRSQHPYQRFVLHWKAASPALA